MTTGEALLWEELRGRKLGVRFRRKDPVGPYIADFTCRRIRLVIEVDGISHGDYVDKDAARDRWMTEVGWTVLRFPDDWVKHSIEETVAVIVETVEALQRGERVTWRQTGDGDGFPG